MKTFFRASFGFGAMLLLASCAPQTGTPLSSASPSAVSSPVSSAAAGGGDAIKLGFIGPLTGDAANLGLSAMNAVKLGVDEINNAGGINGKKLQVIYEDGRCNGKDANAAANKLVNADKVFGIIGAMCSAETIAVAGVTEPKQVPLVSYCSSAPTVTTAGDFVFRTYPSDTKQGKFAAEFARKRGYTKAAILYVKTDYGTGVQENFSKRFKELGGEEVSKEGYEQNSRDLRTQLTKVQASGADMLYFVAYPEAAAVGIKQTKEVGLKTAILGADAFDDPKMFTDLGNVADGVMYTVASSLNSAEFNAKMKARTGSDAVLVCSPYAYDTVHIFADILRQTGTDAAKFKDALSKLKYTKGVSSSTIEFDENGDVKEAKYVVKQSRGGIVGEITE